MSAGYSAPPSTLSSSEAQQNAVSHEMGTPSVQVFEVLIYLRKTDSILAYLSGKVLHSAVVLLQLRYGSLIVWKKLWNIFVSGESKDTLSWPQNTFSHLAAGLWTVSQNKLRFLKTPHLSCPFEAQFHPNKWGHSDECPFHSTKKGHKFCSQPVPLCCFACFLFSLLQWFWLIVLSNLWQ